jgi:hypothetical protein
MNLSSLAIRFSVHLVRQSSLARRKSPLGRDFLHTQGLGHVSQNHGTGHLSQSQVQLPNPRPHTATATSTGSNPVAQLKHSERPRLRLQPRTSTGSNPVAQLKQGPVKFFVPIQQNFHGVKPRGPIEACRSGCPSRPCLHFHGVKPRGPIEATTTEGRSPGSSQTSTGSNPVAQLKQAIGNPGSDGLADFHGVKPRGPIEGVLPARLPESFWLIC